MKVTDTCTHARNTLLFSRGGIRKFTVQFLYVLKQNINLDDLNKLISQLVLVTLTTVRCQHSRGEEASQNTVIQSSQSHANYGTLGPGCSFGCNLCSNVRVLFDHVTSIVSSSSYRRRRREQDSLSESTGRSYTSGMLSHHAKHSVSFIIFGIKTGAFQGQGYRQT